MWTVSALSMKIASHSAISQDEVFQMTEGRLLTVREAAKLTGFTEACWRNWILRRKVPFYRINRSVRVAERDLQKLIEEARIPSREGRNGL